jgi:steroid 5-alpha reductase family enzyme
LDGAAMLEMPPLVVSALCGLGATIALAFVTWVVSFVKADVSIVDGVWAMLVLLAGAVYAVTMPESTPRSVCVLTLAALWAIRLTGYITWRNWGEPEDHRYREIRARNQPHFEWKSLYLVFGLQGVLAWIVSAPLLAALASSEPLNALDAIGIVVVAFGLVFETIGDAQLARFKSHPQSRGQVMDSGLWRYTRHPNYFGEFCVWWGFYLVVLAGGGWWAMVSPILMSILLLRVSGVTLLEKDIGERRPAYRDYIARTNAFFPGPARAGAIEGR